MHPPLQKLSRKKYTCNPNIAKSAFAFFRIKRQTRTWWLMKKRILEQLVNSSPLALQVIVTLWVTAVIHFKTLVTHSSPKSLYLVEYVENIHANHSSPLVNVLRVTSELIMQTAMYQDDTHARVMSG